MAESRTHAEREDALADDRDKAANRRDMIACRRDEAARRRDDDAADRDVEGTRTTRDSVDRQRRLREHVLDHFTRMENIALDPDAWSDLAPAAFERLRALLSEQRLLAIRERAAIIALLDGLDDELHNNRMGRLTADRDRRAAAEDRCSSGRDRGDSAGDRELSAGDRGQAEIAREQVDSTEMTRFDQEPADEAGERLHPMVVQNKRSIAERRALIGYRSGHTPMRAPTPRHVDADDD
jgi:hypothetical protein